MIYLLYGNMRFLINDEVNKIIDENKIEGLNISRYNFDNQIIDTLINDCETYSLFDDKKIIIVDNADIFKAKNKEVTETNFNSKKLESYLLKPNPDTILIFILNNEKIDQRKKVVNYIKKRGKIIEFNQSLNNNSDVLKLFDGYEIDNKTINYLIDKVGNEFGLIYQECQKLKMYKFDSKTISIEDIDNCATENIDLNFFNFIENIISKNTEVALKQYYEMLKRKEHPQKIIVALSRQIRTMFQTRVLRRKGYSPNNIAEILGENPYYISECLRKSYNFEEEYLYLKLEELADLDIDIKTGKVDSELGLELFIINA